MKCFRKTFLVQLSLVCSKLSYHLGLSVFGATSALAAANDGGQFDDIRDIKGLLVILPANLPLLIILSLVGIVAVVLLFRRYWNRLFPPKSTPQPSLKEVTLEKLDLLRLLISSGREKEFASGVSEVLREYLENRYQFPVCKQTTEEFLAGLLSERTLPVAKHQELLQGFLSRCDLAKFANQCLESAEMELLLDDAKRLVINTSIVEQLDVAERVEQ